MVGLGLGLVPLVAAPALAAPGNDEITSATLESISTGTSSFAVSNVSATSNSGDPDFDHGAGDGSDSDAGPCYGHATVWYRLALPSSGRLVVTLSGASAGYDAVFGLYKASGSTPTYTNVTDAGPASPSADARIGNTDFNTSATIQIDAVTTSGGPYLLGLAGCAENFDDDGDPGVTGTATVTTQFIGRPSNDAFASAAALTATQTADVRGANTAHEANEPNSDGGNDSGDCYGGASIWYSIAPGVGRVEVTTSGESFDADISVLSGAPSSALGALSVVDRDRVGLTFGHADIVADTVAGQKYWVRVEACNASGTDIIALADLGSLTLASTFAPAPANDAFATPTVLSGPSGTAAGDNTGATVEVDEPDGDPTVGNDVEKSVWYSWTLPASGDYVVSTTGAPFNTILGVGTKVSAISGFGFDVAANDNVSTSNLTSRVQFTGTSGEKLLIRVSGVDDGTHPSTGAFTLTYGPAPDQVAPTAAISSPAAGSRVLTTVPLLVKVAATDAKSGVAAVHIAVTGLPEQIVTAPTSGSYSASFDLTGVAHNAALTISAYSVDNAGNESAVTTRGIVADDGTVHAGYCGSTRGVIKAASGRCVTGAKGAKKAKTSWTSTKKKSTITVRFVGKQVDLYLLTSARGGKATLTLDGKQSTVDLGAKKSTDRLVRFVGLNAVSHVLVITNTGAKGKGSKGTVVQLDKFRVYDPN